MKKPVIITMFLLASSLLVKAQDNVKQQAQPDSIIKIVPIDVGRHVSYICTIGGKIQSPEDIKIKLLAYAPSAREFGKTKTNLTWAYVSSAGFALSGLAATLEFAHNNKMAGETTGFVNGQPAFIYQHHSLAGAYIFTGLATAFLASAIINYVHAAKHGNKALNVYNQRFE